MKDREIWQPPRRQKGRPVSDLAPIAPVPYSTAQGFGM